MTQCNHSIDKNNAVYYCTKKKGHLDNHRHDVFIGEPTIVRQQITLSQQLKKLRVDAGYNLEKASELMDMRESDIKEIETAISVKVFVKHLIFEYLAIYNVKFIISADGVEMINEINAT